MLFSEVVCVKGEVEMAANGRFFAAPVSATKVSVNVKSCRLKGFLLTGSYRQKILFNVLFKSRI